MVDFRLNFDDFVHQFGRFSHTLVERLDLIEVDRLILHIYQHMFPM